MKRHFLVAVLALGLCSLSFQPKTHAQALGHDYKTGLGVKIGYWGGGALDVKHFMNPTSALEGQFSFSRNWFMVTGLYEFHGDIDGAPGLKWYVGPGAHLGFYNNRHQDHYNSNTTIYAGVDGVLGLDYKFNKAPISLSLDIQPAFSFPNGDFNIWGGLGIRFTL